MGFKVDFSSIKTVKVHKEQFDSINEKAKSIILECCEDGRVIAFNRVGVKAESPIDEYRESAQELLNPYGKYLLQFAENHNISVSEAAEHPMVRARYEYFCKTGA